MKPFYEQHPILAILALGGLAGLAEQAFGFVEKLYKLALTPHGLAGLVVATFLLSAASLAVVFIKKMP